ncbi:ankyrin repeat domain-containing protein [soil metagenome]
MNKLHDIILFTMHGNSAQVALLLKNGVHPDECDDGLRTALHWAVQEGHIDIIEDLIRHGASLNAIDNDGFTPLAIAVGENKPSALKCLLNAGASPNILNPHDGNGTPLHLACAWGFLEVAKILVDAPQIDINAKDANGRTCLNNAVEAGAKELIDYLLDHGATGSKS